MRLIVLAVLLTGGGILLFTKHIEKNNNVQIYSVAINFGEDPVKISQRDIVLPILLYGGIFLLLITSIEMLIYSNRIAGPIYRLRKEMEDMANGNIGGQINFRKKDEFKELAENLNLVKKKYEIEINAKKRYESQLAFIKGKLQILDRNIEKKEIDAILKEIEKL